MKFEIFFMKNWLFIITSLPFIIMFLLHISIAFNDYFNININIPDIYVSDWFMFCSSYFGGAITLMGVNKTILYSSKLHQHQISMAKLQEEKTVILQSISQLNVQEPFAIFQLFLSMNNETRVITDSEVALIYERIVNTRHKIASTRILVFISSDITIINPNCTSCKNFCHLKTIVPKICEAFESCTGTLHDTLGELERYIIKTVEFNKKFQELKYQQQNEQQNQMYILEQIIILEREYKNFCEDNQLRTLCEKCSTMYQNEISQLIELIRIYFIEKETKVRNDCFSS